MPSNKDAAYLAKLVTTLCEGERIDPREEAMRWVGEFASSAVDEFDATGWGELSVIVELKERERNRSAADRAHRRPILFTRDGELWLPAGALQEFTNSKSSPPWRFDQRMSEIGWRKERIETRPTTRAERKTGKHHERRFYVGDAD